MNKVQENLLKSLGLEIYQEFEFYERKYGFCINIDGGLHLVNLDNNLNFWATGGIADDEIYLLINNPEKIHPIKKPILDKVEKKYLENVLRPFKDRIDYIELNISLRPTRVWIDVQMNQGGDILHFPNFKLGTMYKGMEIRKKYTLKELGLFEE